MCNCKNIIPQSQKCYDQMIVVEIPSHMFSYKQSRLNKGLSDKICIDPCIFDEIQSIWDKGVITLGSCCGHNNYSSFVNVHDDNINQMIEMGYVQEHLDKERKDTFKLKSV